MSHKAKRFRIEVEILAQVAHALGLRPTERVDIARVLGLTPQGVRKIELRALEKMRQEVKT